MDIFGYLAKIGECIDRLEKKYYEHYDKKILIAFRGESRNFENTKLMPSMFRESEYIYKENYLFDLFCDLGLIKDNDKWIDKATDTQHYAALSRMLDITFAWSHYILHVNMMRIRWIRMGIFMFLVFQNISHHTQGL